MFRGMVVMTICGVESGEEAEVHDRDRAVFEPRTAGVFSTISLTSRAGKTVGKEEH